MAKSGTGVVPVIRLGAPAAKKKAARKPKLKVVKAKVKAKPKAKAAKVKKAARKRKPAPRLDQVPAAMAPPEMPDTRPTPRPIPVPVPKEDVSGTTATATGAIPTATSETVVERVGGEPVPVQGATCTWMGVLSDAAKNPITEIPECPHCGGRLLTAPDRLTQLQGFEAFEIGVYPTADHNNPARPHPGYTRFMGWLIEQGKVKCWAGDTSIIDAANAYLDETGKHVDPTL